MIVGKNKLPDISCGLLCRSMRIFFFGESGQNVIFMTCLSLSLKKENLSLRWN